jgi:hypothetical protein
LVCGPDKKKPGHSLGEPGFAISERVAAPELAPSPLGQLAVGWNVPIRVALGRPALSAVPSTLLGIGNEARFRVPRLAKRAPPVIRDLRAE